MFLKYVVILKFFSIALLIAMCSPPAAATESVRLNWVGSASTEVVGYNVYYGSASGVYSDIISVSGDTTVSVDNLAEGVTYYFAVTAFNSSGMESEPSNEASYTVAGVAPPTGVPFIMQALVGGGVQLGWQPSPTPGIQGYYVHYGTQSGSYDNVLWVPNGTQVSIMGLTESATYYFAVTALGSSGTESVFTPEVPFTIQSLVPPQSAPFVQQVLPNNGITLAWNPSPSADILGYHVYYGTQSGSYYGVVWVAGASQVDIQNLSEGVTYYFVVTTIDNSGAESTRSLEMTYLIPAPLPPTSAPVIQQVQPNNGITLTWSPSPSTNIVGYYVYYGTQSGMYDQIVWVPDSTTVDIPYLGEGRTNYFSVVSVDSYWMQSDYTPELAYQIPLPLPPQKAPAIQQFLPNDGITLTWNPSPSANILGYYVFYGTSSGNYGNVLWVQGSTQVDIQYLTEGVTNYFAVIAIDAIGMQSDYSAEAAELIQPISAPPPAVYLSLQPLSVPGFPNAFSVTASGVVPATWTLEGSANLKSWHTLATGVEPDVNVSVVVAENPALFFRLNSNHEGIPLELQTDATNQYPNSFVVTTPSSVPWAWTLESSADLQHWSPLTTGSFAPVKVAVVHAPTPALFFRLKGG